MDWKLSVTPGARCISITPGLVRPAPIREGRAGIEPPDIILYDEMDYREDGSDQVCIREIWGI
ncbi:MAG: hypothetical protein PHG75_08225 [Syntrophomonas sp.]|nr:hypothetical protein [Syntrophomonas sp.]